jgi:TfoX/Sxy family transcriptional regulator of competence genes
VTKAPSKVGRRAAATKPVAARARKTPAAAAVDPRLEAIAKAFERTPGVTFGKLFASMGLKVGGKIFAMVVRGRLVVKLPKSRVDELVASRAGTHFEPGPGRVMKEWIAISSTKLDPVSLAREAFAFVRQ